MTSIARFTIFCALLAVNADALTGLPRNDRLHIDEARNDFDCRVYEKEQAYIFEFSVDDSVSTGKFSVNAVEHPMGLMEYAWSVFLEGGEKKAEIGIYFFKKSSTTEEIGFRRLLRRSQLAFFRYEPEGTHMLDEQFTSALSGEISGRFLRLKFELRNEEARSWMAGLTQANFWILAAGDRPLKCRYTLSSNTQEE